MAIGKRVIETAMENGGTLAGIASMEAVRVSASHRIYIKMGNYSGIGTVKRGCSSRQSIIHLAGFCNVCTRDRPLASKRQTGT